LTIVSNWIQLIYEYDSTEREACLWGTELFDKWIARLKDSAGKALIIKRIRSAERGNFGDCFPIGNGVSEMRIHSGPGYRVYFTRTDDVVYVLLCGGSKRRQQKDVTRAIAMATELKEK